MQYKVIKQAPGLNIGDVYEKRVDSQYISNNINAFNVLMRTQVEDNKEWFEEIKEVKSIFELTKGDEYYYINDCNTVVRVILDVSDSFIYEKDLKYGNVFLNREEAETKLSKKEAIQAIKKWSWKNDGGYEWITGNDNYVIMYDDTIGLFTTSYMTEKAILQFYYSSRDIINKALIELEDEYKILFDIK